MEIVKAISILSIMIVLIVGTKVLCNKALAFLGKKKDCSKGKCGCG